MGGANLQERLYVLVANQLGLEREELVPEARILDDLGADSLDVVELVMALEESFDIVVPRRRRRAAPDHRRRAAVPRGPQLELAHAQPGQRRGARRRRRPSRSAADEREQPPCRASRCCATSRARACSSFGRRIARPRRARAGDQVGRDEQQREEHEEAGEVEQRQREARPEGQRAARHAASVAPSPRSGLLPCARAGLSPARNEQRERSNELRRWVLIDAANCLYRAFFAPFPPLRTSDGTPTKARLRLRERCCGRLLREEQPDDVRGGVRRARRRASATSSTPEYKATRDAQPEDLSPQFPLAREIVDGAAGIPMLEVPGFEADDVIATLVARAPRGREVAIVSTDTDLMQLVSERVALLDTMKRPPLRAGRGRGALRRAARAAARPARAGRRHAPTTSPA